MTNFSIIMIGINFLPRHTYLCILNALPFRPCLLFFRRVMAAGASITWREALGTLTGGTEDLDATPLLQYFAPLTHWLENRVQEGNLTLGW